jgi:ribose 5-phosphate isomerase B
MNISIGSDHAGFEYKSTIKKNLSIKKYNILDVGTFTKDSVDYPEFAHLVAEEVLAGKKYGILICGSANGVCMTANKHPNIRAAICWNTETTKLARQHNNANIICLPARFITIEKSLELIKIFLNEGFEGGRHLRRIEKI